MSLHKSISVNTHYTRSVNVERDKESVEIVSSYIPTSRALKTLSKVAAARHSRQAPRAWSLVGPYGSGKSSFSIFLSHLLSSTQSSQNKAAYAVLKKADNDLASNFKAQNKSVIGYMRVLISGAPEPLGPRIIRGLTEAAVHFWGSKKGRKPAVLNELEKLACEENIHTSELIDIVDQLQSQLLKAGSAGILLVIDELGKFLEYEARHYGANDIFLLQSLAEHACRGHQANLLLCVLLHQSFEQYAKGLGEGLKKEWSKVQGRFEEVPFLESSEQTLRVVSAAIETKFSAQQRAALKKNMKQTLSILRELDALPGQMSIAGATSLFLGCYPFHPVTAILLPMLCQKVAQNERTLFSYLGSHEQYGMREIIQNIKSVNDSIMPSDVYDYFITNQSASIGDHITHRRWVEVVTAIERLGDANSDEVSLLKTIGLMNIVGSRSGFKPSKLLLSSLGLSKTRFRSALKMLEEKSVITFRKFSNEFRVWQGSDFDLELRVQEELANIGKFSLAKELNKTESLMPVVARKYTINSGSFRYFVPFFIDAVTFKEYIGKGKSPRILFYLSTGKDDEVLFRDRVVKSFSLLDLVVLCRSADQLREAIAETQALIRIESSSPQLEKDPIAKKEFEDRFITAKQTQHMLLQETLDKPQLSVWYSNGSREKLRSKKEMQQLLSRVLETVYSKSPLVYNELINRDVPSSQSIGARNKLLLAMLLRESAVELGIEKSPPEKAMYRSLLLATGIHREKSDGSWYFTDPREPGGEQARSDIKKSIRAVWGRIIEFFESTVESPRSFDELRDTLVSPPYGIKAGVLPILYFSAYLAHRDELAIFENRRFRPAFDEESVARFIKRPDEFSFQLFRIDEFHSSIFESYSTLIAGNTKEKTILGIAKPFTRTMQGLSDYTKSTSRGLSKNAKGVRDAYDLAKSPQHLLLEGLPKALGFPHGKEFIGKKTVKAFSEELSKTLKELLSAQNNLLEKQIGLISQVFELKYLGDLAGLQEAAIRKFSGLERYTVDSEGVRALLIRLINRKAEPKTWLENILSFLGQKDVHKWNDSDVDHAEQRLVDYSKRINDLERLRFYEDGDDSNIGAELYLIRSTRKGGEAKDGLVTVKKEDLRTVNGAVSKVSLLLNELESDGLRMSVLAKAMDTYLRSIDN